MLHALVAVAGQVDGQLLRLLRLQIEGVEIAAVFEDDGIRTQARPHHVEVGEVGELFDLLAAQVVAVEIEVMLGAAIGGEVDRVAMPHGKGVGPIGVGHVFDSIVFEIVDGDGLGQAAGVALPGAEVAEDRVVGDLRAVGRKRSEAALIDGQRLGQTAVDAHAEGTLGPAVRGIATREKQNALAVREPGDDFIVNAHAIAERRRGSLIESQLPGLAALSGHHVDVEIAVVLAGEGDPFAVGRKFREQLAPGIGGDAARVAARARGQPKIAAVHENNLVFIDVGKAHQAAFRHFLADPMQAKASSKNSSNLLG